MKFGKLAAGAALLVMPLSGLMSGASYAQSTGVVYVSTTGSDTSGNGTSGQPYRTINQAVQSAAPGSVIMVEPGTYTGMVTVTKPVTIQSDPANGGGATSTIIDATGQNNGIFINGAAATGTVIEGLTIEHANNQAVLVDNANDVTIAKNDIVDNGLQPTVGVLENKPITLVGSSYSVVAGNTVTGNQAGGGIAIADNGAVNPGVAQNGNPAQGVAGFADANLVIANTLSGNGGGSAIAVTSYNGGQGAAYNQVIGNTMTNNASGVMVAAEPTSANSSVSGTVISGNTIQQSAMPGVIVQTRGGQSGETVTGTIVTGNTLSGNGPLTEVSLAQPAAIVAVSSGVADTTITNNTISAEAYGVWNSGAVNTSVANNRTDSTVVTPVYGVASQSAGATNGNISIVVNGSALLTVPSIADGNQTFIPIWYVMSELKSLGMTSAWAKGVWNLTLPTGVTVNTSAIPTGTSGNIAITANGNLLLRMNGFAAPNPLNGQMTTFAPITDLSQLLAGMGIQNQVSAGMWNIVIGGSSSTGTTTTPPASSNTKSLVALGDSITFGFGLGTTNLQPSPEAFPYLIGKAGNLSVTDLGVPGLTSSGLLTDLATTSFQKAVKGASVITLDIGSNDLLQPATKDGLFTGQTITPTELAQFATVVQQFTTNLQTTLQTLVKLNPTAKIVVYNIYNPVPSSDTTAHAVADQVLSAMNAAIAQEAGAFHLPVANAYSAFSGHVSQYILTGNVHPNAQGQAVLAKIGEQALSSVSASTN